MYVSQQKKGVVPLVDLLKAAPTIFRNDIICLDTKINCSNISHFFFSFANGNLGDLPKYHVFQKTINQVDIQSNFPVEFFSAILWKRLEIASKRIARHFSKHLHQPIAFDIFILSFIYSPPPSQMGCIYFCHLEWIDGLN